jgi:hypothetical protein
MRGKPLRECLGVLDQIEIETKCSDYRRGILNSLYLEKKLFMLVLMHCIVCLNWPSI